MPTLSAEGIDAVNLHHTDWSGGLTTLFHRFQRVCFGWDMQFEHVIRPALRMGIDGIFSDHVDVMVDAFRADSACCDRGAGRSQRNRPTPRITPNPTAAITKPESLEPDGR